MAGAVSVQEQTTQAAKQLHDAAFYVAWCELRGADTSITQAQLTLARPVAAAWLSETACEQIEAGAREQAKEMTSRV
jgi:hypothetical protein